MKSYTHQSNSEIKAQLVDELMDRYLDWREQCLMLWKAYERWANCPLADRRLAFEAYKAALDLEEHASRVYSDRVKWLSPGPSEGSPSCSTTSSSASTARPTPTAH
jgi:hypothetical protein